MREFREESKAMGKSIDSTHDKIDEEKVLINAQREDIYKCLDVIDVLKEENSQLQRELEQVKKELCDVQQYSGRNTVDIQRVPENKSENLFEVVKAVAKVLQFDLKPEMIDAVHRLASRQRGIILKCSARGLIRTRLLIRKVFVNPSLSNAFRELLYHAKCTAREGRVRFAWYSNGKVLVRKRDHITSKHQLQDLQQTWLDESVYSSELFTDEWSVWRSDGTDRVRGRGVLVAVRDIALARRATSAILR
ncbi:hypothetical protein J6590_015081 [Homalodisca vitripennis]|nr:hypothetical protein J6590_015081 [Homalodisca vitripennis]